MASCLLLRHGGQRWLSPSFGPCQRAVSTNASLKCQCVKGGEFAVSYGGGSRPLATCEAGHPTSMRFTSRCIAERDRNLEALWPLASAISLNSWWLRQFTRASRRCVQRETAHEVGFAVDAVTVGHRIAARAHRMCASARRGAPCRGSLCRPRFMGSLARRLRASTHATRTHWRCWGRRFARAMLALVLAPRISSGGALTVPWSTGAAPHPSVCLNGNAGTGTQIDFVGEIDSLGQSWVGHPANWKVVNEML